jgi:hypothetical protein
VGHQTLDFRASAASDRYENNAFLDNTSGDGAANWNWQLARRWSGQLGTHYARTLSGFGNRRLFERDLFETLDHHASARYSLNSRWQLTADAKLVEGSHDNPGRQSDDFESESGAAGVEYRSRSGNVLSWEVLRTRSEFIRDREAGELSDRDFEETQARFELSYALTGKTAFIGSAGYLRREYPQNTEAEFSGDVWNAALQWEPTVKLRLSASAWQQLKAYFDAESDHFVGKGYGFTATWAPARKLSLAVQQSFEEQDYLGSAFLAPTVASRRDEIESLQAQATYRYSDHWSLELLWRREVRDSTSGFFDYDSEMGRASVSFRF